MSLAELLSILMMI